MNQTVLLRGINDDAATLERLFRGLIRARVRPYYLLQMDPVKGTGHLRTPLATGVGIIGARCRGGSRASRCRSSSCDTPGGMGKVPIAAGHGRLAGSNGRTRLRTHRGEEVDYVDPS
jgi:lysine 2,3-aminomutase